MKLPVAAETFNPVIVDFYEQVGYLPDAIVNYLRAARLVARRQDRVLHARADGRATSRSSACRQAPASFDPAKLLAFQTQYMQEVPLDEKVQRVRPFLERAGMRRRRGARGAAASSRRSAIASRCSATSSLQGAYFFGDEVPAWDEKAFAKRVLAPGAVDKLAAYRDWLGGREAFDAASLERDTQAWLAERGWALGDIVHAVRVAVTGVGGGPGLFDCLALIGREVCVRRIERAVAKARG